MSNESGLLQGGGGGSSYGYGYGGGREQDFGYDVGGWTGTPTPRSSERYAPYPRGGGGKAGWAIKK